MNPLLGFLAGMGLGLVVWLAYLTRAVKRLHHRQHHLRDWIEDLSDLHDLQVGTLRARVNVHESTLAARPWSISPLNTRQFHAVPPASLANNPQVRDLQ